MSTTDAPAFSTRHHGGPTRDLVNDVAELIRRGPTPVVAARAAISRVQAAVDRADVLAGLDRDALAVALRRLCDAYDDANRHGAFATNGVQQARLEGVSDAWREAVELLDEVGA